MDALQQYLLNLHSNLSDISNVAILGKRHSCFSHKDNNIKVTNSSIHISENIIINLESSIDRYLFIRDESSTIIIIPVDNDTILVVYGLNNIRLGMLVNDLEYSAKEIRSLIE